MISWVMKKRIEEYDERNEGLGIHTGCEISYPGEARRGLAEVNRGVGHCPPPLPSR